MSQNGTIIEKSGSCLPIILLRTPASIPVTPASATIGVPIAPKATGAVLAMSERADASSGPKPSPMSSAPVMATGVPNPAVPSKNDPSAKAMSTS